MLIDFLELNYQDLTTFGVDTVKLDFKELFGHHKKFLKVKSSLFQTFNQSTI